MKFNKRPFSEKLSQIVFQWETKDISDSNAQVFFQEAKTSLSKKQYSRTCNCLGNLYFLAKDYKEAEKLFKKASTYSEQELNPIELAQSIINTAKIYREIKRFLNAEIALMCCQDVLETHIDGFSPAHWFLLEESVELQLVRKDIGLLEAGIDKAVDANENHDVISWQEFKEWLGSLMTKNCNDHLDEDDKIIKDLLVSKIVHIEEMQQRQEMLIN